MQVPIGSVRFKSTSGSVSNAPGQAYPRYGNGSLTSSAQATLPLPSLTKYAQPPPHNSLNIAQTASPHSSLTNNAKPASAHSSLTNYAKPTSTHSSFTSYAQPASAFSSLTWHPPADAPAPNAFPINRSPSLDRIPSHRNAPGGPPRAATVRFAAGSTASMTSSTRSLATATTLATRSAAPGSFPTISVAQAGQATFSASPSGYITPATPTTATPVAIQHLESGPLGSRSPPYVAQILGYGNTLGSVTGQRSPSPLRSPPLPIGQCATLLPSNSTTALGGSLVGGATYSATALGGLVGGPTYSTSALGGSLVGGPTYALGGSMVAGATYIPNDHHEVEEAYRKFAEGRDLQLEKDLHPWKEQLVKKEEDKALVQQEEEDEKPSENSVAESNKNGGEKGIVGKIEDKVKNTVNAVEDKVKNTVTAVKEKVAEEVHAVHDTVSGFFGMIGNLFHSNKKPETVKGPAGSALGKGSTVEVTRDDGSKARGHVVQDDGDSHLVQLHTDSPGKVITVSSSSVAHVTTYAPVVGAGVEVFYEGEWYTGHVVALPLACQDPPVYEVRCHGDPPDQQTFADERSIRPLLSPEERDVVAWHMADLQEKKNAADKAKAAAVAAEAAAKIEAEEAQRKKDMEAKMKNDFKEKLDSSGLSSFYPSFIEHGYDTEDSLQHMHDDELRTFGMKPGHISKFYKAFPRGTPYKVSNALLKSSAAGIPYRSSKSLSDDSHMIAAFETVVQGTELLDGWLKVGVLYLPMAIDGKQVIFKQSNEKEEETPNEKPEKAEGIVAKVEEKVKGTVAAVENAVGEGLTAFEHMLHFK